eukprot:457071_1
MATDNPTNIPTSNPIFTSNPSVNPTSTNPTITPTNIPTINPTISFNPTAIPTINPTEIPTRIPTTSPTENPTHYPTAIPTYNPIDFITINPTIIPTYVPTNDCIECEIYNLTLVNINANISVKECELETVINKPNCDCNGNGMIALNMRYIGNNIATKIEIFYKDNIVLCTFYNVALNMDNTCNIRHVSNYLKFRTITTFRIYYQISNRNYICSGQYDTSCNTYTLGNVDTNCPYLMMNGWIDYNNNICFNDGTNVHIKYWTKRTIYSDSSNHETITRQSYSKSNDKTKSRSSDRRRRRLGNGISTKCVWHNDNKYIWHKNEKDCDDYSSDSSDTPRRRLWSNYYRSSDSSSDSSEDGPMKILHRVCLTYEIGILNDNCGILESIFMPLCENNQTTFNSSSVTTDDITDLIVKYDPENGIIPIGYRDNNNILGILVKLINNNIKQFELCLGNVTIDLNVNYTQDAIDIADTVTFVIDNQSSICQSDGLPCLNFYFAKECPTTTAKTLKSCDCNKGLQSITFLYSGNKFVDKIEIFSRKRNLQLLCVFNIVSNGDTIVCNGHFNRKIYIRITYSNSNDICDGMLRTDCSCNIYGMSLSNCNNDLIVIEWIDKIGAICDDTVADNKIHQNN